MYLKADNRGKVGKINSVEILEKYKKNDVLTCQGNIFLIFFEIFGTGRTGKGKRRNNAGMYLRATAGQWSAAGNKQEIVYNKTNIFFMFFLLYLVSVREATAYSQKSSPGVLDVRWTSVKHRPKRSVDGAWGKSAKALANGAGVGLVP